MKRTKEEAAQTRQAVLEAALEVFSRKGYAKTSLGEIATEAGVTRGAVYWHFNNKLDMFKAVNEYVDTILEVRFDKIKEADISPLAKLKRMLTEMFVIMSLEKEYRVFEELKLFRFEKDSQLYQLYLDQLEDVKELINIFKDVIKQGIQCGELASDLNVEITVMAIVSYLAGMRSTWVSDVRTFSIPENAQILADTFINGLAKR